MLVADGVAQFERDAYQGAARFALQRGEVGHHHVAQAYAHSRHAALLGQVFDYVAVGELRAALQGDGVTVAALAFDDEAALLRRPLVEVDILHLGLGHALGPLGIVYVALDFGIDFHL